MNVVYVSKQSFIGVVAVYNVHNVLLNVSTFAAETKIRQLSVIIRSYQRHLNSVITTPDHLPPLITKLNNSSPGAKDHVSVVLNNCWSPVTYTSLY